MADNHTRLVTEEQLQRIYTATDSPNEMQREVRRVFQETERVDTERTEQARAEGFAAGMFLTTTMMMVDDKTFTNTLYGAAHEDVADVDGEIIDGEEILRELEEVEDLDNAAEWLEENNTFKGSVITPHQSSDYDLYVFEPNKMASMANTPPGWKASNENDGTGIGFRKK